MNVEIIAIGNELLFGHVVNTHATYLSRTLHELGHTVLKHTAVSDLEQDIIRSLKDATSRAELIILTGGLGPTPDDRTRQAVSIFSEKTLIKDADAYQKICQYFQQKNQSVPANNEKQAFFPEGACIFQNTKGTAPGFMLKHQESIIVALPGPTMELKEMFENQVLCHFKNEARVSPFTRHFRLFGIGESRLCEQFEDLAKSYEDIDFATYVGEGDILLRVSVSHKNQQNLVSEARETMHEKKILPRKPLKDQQNKLEKKFECLINELKKRFQAYIFSEKNESLAEDVANRLLEKKLRITIAESCTGGLIATTMTNIAGSSAFFERGFVCYSNESKMEMLHVSPNTLHTHGAVSEQTAIEMATGAFRFSKATHAIAVTGNAGPTSQTSEKTVGLLYIAITSKENTHCTELKLFGSRSTIRQSAMMHALFLLRKIVQSTSLPEETDGKT